MRVEGTWCVRAAARPRLILTARVQVEASVPHKKATSLVSKRVTLVVVSLFLIVSRAAHVLFAQPFKKDFKVNVPMYLVIIECCSFPIALFGWIALSLYQRGELYVENWRYRIPMYALMAALDGVNTITASVGLSALPATVYTILKASSIVFSVAFSKIFTAKQFTVFHYLAVAIMMSASAVMGFYGNKDSGQAANATFGSFVFAATSCVVSSATLGALGVVTYKFIRHEKQKSDLLCIAENVRKSPRFHIAIR